MHKLKTPQGKINSITSKGVPNGKLIFNVVFASWNKFYFYGEKVFLIDEIYIHEKILYLTKGPKFSPNNKKKNGPVCNLVTCLVRNYASINYIFLVSIPNCDPFKALDSRFPKFQNHIWFSLRNLMAWIWFRF